jgi:membrane protein DedA with SNARE-associated domain
MQGLTTMVVEFVQTHQFWAPLVVFALAFGESLAFLSLVLPATVILLAIGGLIGASGIEFFPIWLAGAVGSILGYWFSYEAGRYFQDRVHNMWPFNKRPDLFRRGQKFFESYGALSVFLGHFFGPVRAVIPVVAGMYALRRVPFHIANITSSFIWATGVMAPGVLGVKWLTG